MSSLSQKPRSELSRAYRNATPPLPPRENNRSGLANKGMLRCSGPVTQMLLGTRATFVVDVTCVVVCHLLYQATSPNICTSMLRPDIPKAGTTDRTGTLSAHRAHTAHTHGGAPPHPALTPRPTSSRGCGIRALRTTSRPMTGALRCDPHVRRASNRCIGASVPAKPSRSSPTQPCSPLVRQRRWRRMRWRRARWRR